MRFCTDTLDNDLMALRLQKNYMLLPSAILRFFGEPVGVRFSIFENDLIFITWDDHTHTHTHIHTHTHTHNILLSA